jgi:hypothetical protein
VRIRNTVFGLLMLVFPTAVFSQSTLNFPRAFTTADLGATGFAVVNPGSTNASVTFTLYNAAGAVIATSAQTIAASGQLPILGTQLFPSATQAGWVQLTSSTSGLQGFWVGGDFATFTDGADAAPTSNDLVFPLVTNDTELNIANTSTTTNSITIRLFGVDGIELAAAATRSIAPNGVLQSSTAAFFPAANLNNARYARVTGSAGLTGTAVINNFLVNEWGVANGVSVANAGTQANFPHVVSGVGAGGNYTTIVGVTNLSASSQSVSITFTPGSGGAPITVSRTLPANGSLRDTAQNLFTFPAAFQDGWVQITGSAALTAFVAYADSVAGGLAIVPVQTSARSTLMFAHIADLVPWLTGIALLNTSTSAASVSLYAMNPDGSLIGGADNVQTAQFTLNGGTKTAKLLSQLIPQTQLRSNDGGFIFIRSTQPLYGIELFFTRNLRILANVAAGSGTGFTPPPPPTQAPLVLSSISPTRIAIGSMLTLSGSGFSSNAASNTLVFTGASGTISAAAATSTSNSLTVPVPAGAITGPVFVQTAGQTSASKILEVMATSTSLLPASAFTVDAGSTTSGMDIYVPPPVTTLNATIIGVGDPGTSISLNSSSIEITRGQTKQLVLSGTAISPGATISISGDGITMGAVQFQNGFAFVNVTILAAATPGARNVTVTNASLDVTALSGGLFIR